MSLQFSPEESPRSFREGQGVQKPPGRVTSKRLFFKSDPGLSTSNLPGPPVADYRSNGPRPVSLPTLCDRERDRFWSIIHNPALDTGQILSRQEVIDTLLGEKGFLSVLHERFEPVYLLDHKLRRLLEVEEGEHFRASLKKTAPRCNLAILIEAGLTDENFDYQKARPEFIERARSLGLRDAEGVIECLEGFDELPLKLEMAVNAVDGLNHPLFQASARIFSRRAAGLSSVSVPSLVNLIKDKNVGEAFRIKKQCRSLADAFADVGCLIAFARMIQRDGMGRVTFDANEPACAVSSWNLLREKTSPCAGNSQVLNDIPALPDLTVLSGSNMGGKSYYLQQRLYFQLCAQAFGYAPAARANCRVYSGFHYLERSSGWQSLLSSFGQEVSETAGVWKRLGARPFVVIDELFASTDVRDQCKLLVGLSRSLLARGAAVTLSTHNEFFQKWCGRNPNAALYHFALDILDDKISFTHRLTPGCDTANSLLVAKALGFPEPVLARAEAFMKRGGRGLPIRPPSLEEVKDPAAETLAIARWPSFKCFGECFDELFPRTAWYPGAPTQLFWRKTDVWDSSDGKDVYSHNPNHPRSMIGGRERGRTALSWAISDSREFLSAPIHPLSNPFHTQTQDEMISALFIAGGTSRPADLSFRREFFEALARNGAHEAVPQIAEQLNILAWFIKKGELPDLDGFNLRLLDQALQERFLPIEHPDLYSAAVLDLFEMNINLCGTRDRESFQKSKDRIGHLCRLLDRYRAVRCEYPLSEENKKDLKEIVAEAQEAAEAESSDEFDFGSAILSLLKKEYEHVKPALLPLSFDSLSPEVRNAEIASRWRTWNRLSDKFLFSTPEWLREAEKFACFSNTRKLQTEVIEHLLHTRTPQGAKLAQYFRMIFGHSFGGIESGARFYDILRRYGRGSSELAHIEDRMCEAHQSRLFVELQRLSGLARVSGGLATGMLSPIELRRHPGLNISAARSFADPYHREVANDAVFDLGVRCEVLAGSNMSGKSFRLRQIFWTHSIAQAAGLSPADKAEIFPFARILYLDRPEPVLDLNLSAFGHDISSHMELLGAAGRDRPCLILIDEPFSTAPHSFQAALSHAVVAELLERGHFVVTASHCKPFIEALLANRRYVRAAHLEVTTGETGKVEYTHRLRPGTAPSQGVTVARGLGLPMEIIELAEMVEPEDFSSC